MSTQDTTLPPSGQFRKKPVVIDAWRIDFQNKPLPEWVNDAFRSETIDWCPAGEGLYINTLEGLMKGGFGDYLIRGVKCELYACKADIFEATYEVAAIAAQAQPPAAVKDSLTPQQAQQAQGMPADFEQVVQALETAKNGLLWYQDRCKDAVDGSDDEAMEEIDRAIETCHQLAAAPQAEPQAQPEALSGGMVLVPRELLKEAAESVDDYRAGVEFGSCDRKLLGKLKAAAQLPDAATQAPAPQAELQPEREPLSGEQIDLIRQALLDTAQDPYDFDQVDPIIERILAGIGTKGGDKP